jgi:hypothetical protein
MRVGYDSETRPYIPNHCPILLLSSYSAICGSRGEPRLCGKVGMTNVGMTNNDSWGLTPAELRKLRGLEDSAWDSAGA